MPQNNPFFPAVNPSNAGTPLHENTNGDLRVTDTPTQHACGLTAATVVATGPVRVGTAAVLVGGSAVGAIHDCLTTAAAAATNQIAMLPALTTAQISSFDVGMVASLGLVVIPGTGQTVSVSYDEE